MLRRLLATFCFMVVLLGLAYGGSFFYLNRWSHQSIQLTQDKVVDLQKGMTLEQLSNALQQQGLIDQAFVFKLWTKRFGDYSKFQAGQYQFSGRVTPRDIVAKMKNGETFTPIVARIAIPEGFTIRQTAARMAANNIGTEMENLALMKNRALLKSLDVPSPTAEGYMYPAVYEFSEVPDPKSFITLAIRKFWQMMPSDYLNQLKQKKITLNTAVTVASLIELETAIPEERPMVSEVIWRRIAQNDFLGIDAALIYGIEGYKGDIKTVHLRDKNNKYNTRVHRGLPPTPIGAVSRESLEAAINPTSFRYYFYVAKADGSRTHHFSKTLAEHNRHVQQLVKATKADQIRQ